MKTRAAGAGISPKFTRLVCIEESMGVAGSSDWGDSQNLFAPAGVGRDFEFVAASQLKPLERFREYMTFVSNTDCRFVPKPGADPEKLLGKRLLLTS